MFRRRCPSCGKRLLFSQHLLEEPFVLRKTCRYCGAEYRIRKGILHYLLAAVVWIISLFLFIEIGDLRGGTFLQISLIVMLLTLTFRLSMHIGSLQHVRRWKL